MNNAAAAAVCGLWRSIQVLLPLSLPSPNPNPNPTTKQHAIVSIQINTVTCPTYPEKFIRDNVVAQLIPTSIVTVALLQHTANVESQN